MAIAVLLSFLAPRSAGLGYEYKKGGTWNYETLYAPFDFPILKTAEQMMEEMEHASSVHIPYYVYSQSLVRDKLREADQLDLGDYKPLVISTLRSILEKGVLPDDSGLDESSVLYIQREKRASKVPATEVFLLSDARAELLRSLQERTEFEGLDSLLLANSVYGLIVPDLTFDAQTTQAINAEAVRISPTKGTVSAGQLIVSEGELITADVAQILDSYQKEYEANIGHSGPGYLSLLGNIILALMVVCMLGLVIYFGNPLIFTDNRYYYLLFVFTLAAVSILLICRFNSAWLYLAPLTLVALFLQAFMRPSVTVAVYFVSLLPLLVYADHGACLFVVFLAGGMTPIFAFQYLGRGWKQFVLALATFAVMALAYAGLRLTGVMTGIMLPDLLRFFVAAFLAVLGYPLIYLFEKIFNLVSNTRLSELADTSSPLLRELERKAPGTFQHSLQVMNMADAAARAIDANPLLLRVGALYHDIGKIANPLCFVENESLLAKPEDQKYHTGLTPMQSAEDIIKHVSDGLEIAQKYRLPGIVVDFIRTHHGTSVTGYFWGKYSTQKDSDPAMRPRFSYPGPEPTTKEQIILMLCDSVEAASRTLTDYSPEAISAFVEKIIQGKTDEGQFARAEISIKEMGVVKESIKAYLAQTHHGRVVYPTARKKFLNFK